MQILTPGHKYALANFEEPGQPGQVLQFIEKHPDPEDSTGHRLVTASDGTTNEELLAVLIDRMQYLNAKFPCRDNSLAITHLEDALLRLNKRTADRVARNVEGSNKK